MTTIVIGEIGALTGIALICSSLHDSGLSPILYRRICFYPGAEGGGLFNYTMCNLFRIMDERSCSLLNKIFHRLFKIMERIEVLNQKQLWVAEKMSN
jgi:hypothetical protein